MADESLHDSLSAAFDKVDSGAPTTIPAAPAPSTPSPAPSEGKAPATTPPSQAPTRQLPSEAKQQLPTIPGDIQGKPQQPTVQQSTVEGGSSPGELLKAPPSWKPEVREQWAKLPPEVQAEVIRREREVARALNGSAEARRTADQLAKMAQPYQHYIAMEGGDPIRAFGDYLRHAAILRGGTPAQKAQLMAVTVKQFGIDVGLLDQTLTALLGGQPQPGQQQPMPQQQFRDPRLDQLLGEMEAVRNERTQAIANDAAEDIGQFAANATNEFFNDVRHDMGDLLEMSANRGRKMSLQEAYERACLAHPEISKVVNQRKMASEAAKQQQGMDSKRRAALGLTDSGGKAGNSGVVSGQSLRASLEESINLLSNR